MCAAVNPWNQFMAALTISFLITGRSFVAKLGPYYGMDSILKIRFPFTHTYGEYNWSFTFQTIFSSEIHSTFTLAGLVAALEGPLNA